MKGNLENLPGSVLNPTGAVMVIVSAPPDSVSNKLAAFILSVVAVPWSIAARYPHSVSLTALILEVRLNQHRMFKST